MSGAAVVGTGWWSNLSRWSFDPRVLVPMWIAAVAYADAIGRVRRRRPSAVASWRRPAAYFFAGLGAVSLALMSPIDAFADRSLTTHMIQHLLLTVIAPPLLLLGRPITLAYAAWSSRSRARLARITKSGVARLVGSPAVGFAAFAIVLWVSHLSSIYEAALTDQRLHAAEHAAYVTTALLFWWPVVAADPGARRLSYPGRLLYLFLAMPVMSLLGFLVSTADRVLYPHYVLSAGSVAKALADQRLAGTIMWETSMVAGVVALSLVLAAWMRYEDVQTRRVEMLRSQRTDAIEVRGG